MQITNHIKRVQIALRRCCECGIVQPTEQFRLRNADTGQRHAICRQCHRVAQAKFRARRRGKKLDRFASQIHRERDRGIQRMIATFHAMISEFGGMERFVEAWHDRIDDVTRQGKHGVALRHLLSLVDVMIAVAPIEAQRRREYLENASDAELQADAENELVRLVKTVCQQDPAQREVIRSALGL